MRAYTRWLLAAAALLGGGCEDAGGAAGDPAFRDGLVREDAVADAGPAADVEGRPDASPTDAGADVAPGQDAAAARDAAVALDGAVADASPEPDSGPPEPDSGPPEPDAAPLSDAAPLPDAAPLSDAAPWPDRPRGQCVRGADCPSGSCSERAPGGICLGPPCPDGTEPNFGGCNQICAATPDCPLGLECRRGVCLVPRCEADADCEGPYVCRDGLCSRPTCAGGCPAPLRCVAETCVEP